MAAQQDVALATMKPRDLPDMQQSIEPLIAALLAHAPAMSFMQLYRSLEANHPEMANGFGFGERDTHEHEPVRFGLHPRMGFPAGEIARVELDDSSDGPYAVPLPPVVRTTFMGLYGVDAAMPSHYLDDIAQREEGHEAVEAFLDQFHHRFVTLLYRTWKKYRYTETFRYGGADTHSQNLLCLAGFGWGNKPARAGERRCWTEKAGLSL
jgi:type VI secretion system protein ImpH